MNLEEIRSSADAVLGGIEANDLRAVAQEQARNVLDLLEASAKAEAEHKRTLNETVARSNAAYNDVLAERDQARTELAAGVANAFESEAITQISALRGAADAEAAKLKEELASTKAELARIDQELATRVERAAQQIKEVLAHQ